MAWSKKKTFRILHVVVSLLFIFMIGHISTAVLNLRRGSFKFLSWTFFSYMASVFGTGIGCICFRLLKSEAKWPHAIIHSVVPVALIGGHTYYYWFSLTTYTVVLYTIQFILSFHFMVFRYGTTPQEKAFRSGIHAFLGALMFFICAMDGLLRFQELIFLTSKVNIYTHIASLCLLFYAMCTWYLILNPYFDWRRLAILSRKEEISRAPSKSVLVATKRKISRPQ